MRVKHMTAAEFDRVTARAQFLRESYNALPQELRDTESPEADQAYATIQQQADSLLTD